MMLEFEQHLPKVTASTVIQVDKEMNTAQYQYGPDDIRKEVMDEIKDIIGDGKARVTVSADFGIKDFGTGASAMASVSLTCGQDTKTIERAAKIAGDLARDLAQEQRQRAENELQALIAERGPRGGAPRY
jgi:hypothetical protein